LRITRVILITALLCWIATSSHAQAGADLASPVDAYKQLRAFKLSGKSIRAQDFAMTRDRIKMTFNGTFYFAEPVADGTYGAVFSGKGQLQSEPVGPFERESVKRFLKEPIVQATFTTAVLRFTDNTYKELCGQTAGPADAVAPPEVSLLNSQFEPRLLKETGLNLSSRMISAIVNHDNPGVFFAEFDGGNRGRFSTLIDHQARSISTVFGINGGEKGLLFKYQDALSGNDVWSAFYDETDYARGIASYADAFNMVSIPRYKLDVDLRDPGSWVRMQADLELTALTDNVRMIPMQLNEGLSEYDNERRNKGMKVTGAQTRDGVALPVIQDDWETGFSIVLPSMLKKGQKISVVLKLDGKDSLVDWKTYFHYPRSTETWYPRYGYLTRSEYDVTFHHQKTDRVASIGQRVKEGPAGQGTDEWITQWVATDPVALVTFVCGRFQRHAEMADMEGKQTPIEYYSVPGDVLQIDEKFILQEMNNSVRYFRNLFGPYPYGRLAPRSFLRILVRDFQHSCCCQSPGPECR
jgi:hypothetical protein